MSYPSASNVPITKSIGADVTISWEAPYSGGLGVDILAYQILIKDAEGNLVENTEYCDGANDQTIIDNTECLIPMATLSDPAGFNLKQGDLVVA